MPSRSSTVRAQSASSSSARHSGAGTPRAKERSAPWDESSRSPPPEPGRTAPPRARRPRSASSRRRSRLPRAPPSWPARCRSVPEMIAPAWPIVFPGGAEKPAMYATTGFEIRSATWRAAFSSSSPPISPTRTMSSVSSSASKRSRMSTKRRADDRVAADPDDRRVAQPELGELVADLVGERPRARDEADAARGEHLGGDDPDVRLAGREHARAVRPDHASRRGRGRRRASLQRVVRRARAR